MKVGQKVQHNDYGIGVIDSIHNADRSGNFKGGVTIELHEVPGLVKLNTERTIYPGVPGVELHRVFEMNGSKYKMI